MQSNNNNSNDNRKRAASSPLPEGLRRLPERSSSFAMNYESSERIVKGRRWPECIDNTNPDWVQLFGKKNTVNGPLLTPRMAMKIHYTATSYAENLVEDIDFYPRLPKVARPFFNQSKKWRLAFRDCYARIGLRLQKGLDPSPNCTGEEMAFHNIMYLATDAEDGLFGDPVYHALPEYPNDDNYDDILENAVDDLDVLDLFGPNDRGYDSPEGYDDSSSSSDGEDEPNVDNPVLGHGSMASSMLGSGGAMMRTANLHPKDWFLAFRGDRFRDHE